MQPQTSRRSIRLKEYDYTADGSYFITICTQQKEHRFGYITQNEMIPNEAGCMIDERMLAIPRQFPGVSVDACVVMPNHIHFIITVGAAHRGCPPPNPQSRDEISEMDNGAGDDWLRYSIFNMPDELVDKSVGSHDGLPLRGTRKPSVADVVEWFKASSTNYYIRGVNDGKYPAFDRRLWQRNYYEHIIRTDAAYKNICEYIRTNPQRWEQDRLR